MPEEEEELDPLVEKIALNYIKCDVNREILTWIVKEEYHDDSDWEGFSRRRSVRYGKQRW